MTRRVAKGLEEIGIITIVHRLRHHNAVLHRNTTATTRHHAKALVGSGARRNTEGVAGALIHARLTHAIKQMYGTARLRRSVKQREDTGITIIAHHLLHHNVPQHRNTTAMIRQVVKVQEGIGVRHLAHQEVIALMLLARHVLHRRHGIAMIKHHAKALEEIGANLLVQ